MLIKLNYKFHVAPDSNTGFVAINDCYRYVDGESVYMQTYVSLRKIKKFGRKIIKTKYVTRVRQSYYLGQLKYAYH